MRSSLSLFFCGGGGGGGGGERSLAGASILLLVLPEYLQSALVNRIFPPFHVTCSLLQIPGPPDLIREQLSGSSLRMKEQLDFGERAL